MKGSGGPTQVDAEMWKDFLCAKALDKAPQQLCLAIADTAKILCTEEIHPDCLEEYNACRLIPLDKGASKDGTPGVKTHWGWGSYAQISGEIFDTCHQERHHRSCGAPSNLLGA